MENLENRANKRVETISKDYLKLVAKLIYFHLYKYSMGIWQCVFNFSLANICWNANVRFQ